MCYISQQNGMAERKNIILLDMVRLMMAQAIPHLILRICVANSDLCVKLYAFQVGRDYTQFRALVAIVALAVGMIFAL